VNDAPIAILGDTARLDIPRRAGAFASRAAIFIDRDGVLNELVVDAVSGLPESPLDVADVRLLPGAAQVVAQLGRAGILPVCVSNQPAAAKGRISVARLLAIHDRVLELLSQEEAHLAASYLCLHHPRGTVAELSGECACRKPAAGMLIDGAGELGVDLSNSWMVGDTDADIVAGRTAGCRTALVCNPDSVHKRLRELMPDAVGGNLAEVMRLCVSKEPKKSPWRD
jgi:D-glycero-D-manno-heptose 1,7-bisphosphate phosphatase